MAITKFYEANLSIHKPSGTIVGMISNDALELNTFLDDNDCDGCSLNLMIRDTGMESPPLRSVDGEDVYREIRSWL